MTGETEKPSLNPTQVKAAMRIRAEAEQHGIKIGQETVSNIAQEMRLQNARDTDQSNS